MSEDVLKENRETSDEVIRKIGTNIELIYEKFKKSKELFSDDDSNVWAGKDAEAYKRNLKDLSGEVEKNLNELDSIVKEITNISRGIEAQDYSNEKNAYVLTD